MLYNWILSYCSWLSSSRIHTDTVTKGKDILESFVLKCVRVNINKTIFTGNSWINQFFMRVTGRVNNSGEEVLFYCFSWINIFKNGNFLTILISFYFNHFPSKIDIDSSLMAFVKCYFISIVKCEYLFIGSPKLDSGIFRRSSL